MWMFVNIRLLVWKVIKREKQLPRPSFNDRAVVPPSVLERLYKTFCICLAVIF